MARLRVFVTREIPEPGLALLRAECDVEVNPEDRVLTKAELMEGVRKADALLCLLTDTIDAEIMDSNPAGLKVISNYAVGFNNIDVKAATKRRIPVTNTPGVLTETTADFAWSLLMACARRVVEADKYVRSGKFRGWGPQLFLGNDVYGKNLGLIGFGRIGSAVARRARGFDMKIAYFDVNRMSGEDEARYGVQYMELDDLLQWADYISLHVPLLPETKHLIGQRQLSLMKPTAYLINTSRGPVIDERALVEALKERRIAGAGLDVFENEPALAPGLVDLDNVVLAPHIASASLETRSLMAKMAATNLLSVLKGERPENTVNPEVYGRPGILPNRP